MPLAQLPPTSPRRKAALAPSPKTSALAPALISAPAPVSRVERAFGINVGSEEETCCEIIDLYVPPSKM